MVPGFAANEQDYWCLPPVQALAVAFKENYPQHRLSIVAIHYPYQKGRYTWKGLTINAIGGKNRRLPQKFLTWRSCLKTLQQLHREQKVDLIHSFWLNEPAWLAARFAKRVKIPHFCTVMGQDALKDNKYLKRLALKEIETFCISVRSAQALKNSCGKEARAIIPWGADALVREFPSKIETKNIDILGVGSMVEVKNYALFLDVLALLTKEKPKLRAIIVGPGPLTDKLKAKAQTLGIAEQVSFPGFLDRPEVFKLMDRSRVFLHTADYEGQGYCFVEAAARAVPIVSTPVGMAKESQNWKLGNTAKELGKLCLGFLEEERKIAPLLLGSIEDSLETYAKHYRLKK